MRVLAACSLGGAGHFEPLRPFLDAIQQRGDEVVVAIPPALEAMVGAAGFEFQICGEPAEEEVAPIREQLLTAPPEEAATLANRYLFGQLATAAMLPRMQAVCHDWRPDFVLREPCEYASAIVARRLSIPTAQVAISLAEVEAGALARAAPALRAHDDGIAETLHATPYLTRFPASVDPSPFPATQRFRQDEPAPGKTLPAWWQDDDAPLVYMTFGTVLGHMQKAAALYNEVLAAARRIPARVLLTVGRRFDTSNLGAVSDNIHVEPWVPQRDVFPHASVVVCHGGSGTAFGALAAGLPLVLTPLFADQPVNASRIATTGAGLVVEPEQPRNLSKIPKTAVKSGQTPPGSILGEDAVASAVRKVLLDDSYRQAAGRVADEMKAAPAIDEVLAGLLGAMP